MAAGVVETVVAALDAADVDLPGWALAWSRVAPTIALVPAFGLRAIPAPARVVLGLAIAAAVAPALTPVAQGDLPFAIAVLREMARGIPVALSASVALWAATMAGGLIDDLRAARETLDLPVVEPGATPLGALLSMLTAIVFLQSGGPEHVARALLRPNPEVLGPLARAAGQLTAGIELAIAVAAPVLAASIVVEVASALVARAASPAFVQPLLAPLRSIAILGIAALVLERMVELLALAALNAPL